jgi:hypothetical protein
MVRHPAVVIPFGDNGSETTEVTPAYVISSDKDDINTYGIPNGSEGWMKSSPTPHRTWINTEDERLNGKLKPLIRFVKAWKYYQNVTIASFYLELRITEYASNEKSIYYSIDLKNVLKYLLDKGLAAIQDPKGISGCIHPCSEAQRRTLYQNLILLIRVLKKPEMQNAITI